MFNLIKRFYCNYLARLFFHSNSQTDLDQKIDRIIDYKLENAISGDKDLIQAISYIISYRKYERNLLSMPLINNITMIRIFAKSLI